MFLGIRSNIWISIGAIFTLIIIGTLIYIYRKKFKEWWLKWKHPNHTYRILMIYPANRIGILWAKVDQNNQFRINDNIYNLDEEAIHKENKGYGTLMYFEKSPIPITPDIKNFKVKMSSHELGVYKDEELISKLLMVDIGEKLIKIMIILSVVQLCAMAYIIFMMSNSPGVVG